MQLYIVKKDSAGNITGIVLPTDDYGRPAGAQDQSGNPFVPIGSSKGFLPGYPPPATLFGSGVSAANAAVAVTFGAPGATLRNYVTSFTVSWSGGAVAAGVNVICSDASLGTLFDSYFGYGTNTIGQVQFTFSNPLRGALNQVTTFTIAAAGGGVTTKINAQGFIDS